MTAAAWLPLMPIRPASSAWGSPFWTRAAYRCPAARRAAPGIDCFACTLGAPGRAPRAGWAPSDVSNSQPGLITVPGARGAPVYQAARCLLWMVERRGCLAARGVLSACLRRLPSASPSDAAAVHPIPGDRPLSRVADGVTIAFTGRKAGTACGQSSSGQGPPGCTPRSRWRGAGTRSRLSMATGLGAPPAPALLGPERRGGNERGM